MDLPATTWRLLKTPPASGAWNMAVDEAILQSVGRQEALPTLRLFAWDPPCLSLGYAQSYQDVDEEALFAKGWEVVRRATGGKAILHTDEITYSVIGPATDARLEGDILTSYQRLSKALLASLEHLKLSVKALPKDKLESPEVYDPVCFDVPSNYEITVDGKKLVGSAQARKKAGVLQHGSIPLSGDLTRITQVLAYNTENQREEAAKKILARATTVENALGKKVSWEESAKALVLAFEKKLNINFITDDLSNNEIKETERLMTEKYRDEKWTRKVLTPKK